MTGHQQAPRMRVDAADARDPAFKMPRLQNVPPRRGGVGHLT